MSTFPENLKYYRQRKNLSQEELGRLIGVSGVTIMRYEKGLRQPKLEIIKRIANALKIPVANLIDINSPIISKATDRFVSGEHPEEIELYGEIMDDIVMNSAIGSTINDYQTVVAEINQMQWELIAMCYNSLNNDDKKRLCDYACQLMENTEEYKQSLVQHNTQKPPTTK